MSALLLAIIPGILAGSPDEPAGPEKALEVLMKRCVACHGEEKQSGKLRLDTFESVMKGSKSGAVVTPGKSGESLLVLLIEGRGLIEGKGPEGRGPKVMPPPKDGPPLSAGEIRAIRAWIDAGAGAPSPGGGPAPAPVTPPAGSEAPPAPPRAQPVAALAFSPDGRLLVVGGFGSAELRDGLTGDPRARLGDLADLVRAAGFAREGGLLALAGGVPARAGELKLFRVEGDPAAPRVSIETVIAGHTDAIHALAFSRDGKRIATSSYDRLVKVWETGSGMEVATLKDHIDAVFGLAYSPDGSRLASCAADRTVKVWDPVAAPSGGPGGGNAGKRIFTLSDATDGLNGLAFHPSGTFLAAGGADRMLRVWKLGPAGGELHRSAFAHQRPVIKLLYSADGRRIYTAGEDGLVKAWDASALTEELVLEPQSDWPLSLALAPGGASAGPERLAVGRYDGTWSIHDARTGEALAASRKREVAQPAPAKKEKGARKEPAPVAVPAAVPVAVGGAARDALEVAVVDGGTVSVPPSLSSLSLRGLSRGGSGRATLEGRNLAGAEVISTGKGITARVVKNEALPRPEFRRTRGNTGAEIVDPSVPHRLEIELSAAPDAAAGLHTVQARTPLGLTNGISLHVDALPEAAEKEPNDPPGPAQEVGPGAVIAGKMDSSGDVDAFRFQAGAGQELVFDVVASAIGSGMNGLLTLHDAEGKQLASSADFAPGRPDARLGFRFEKGGQYSLRLSDRDFKSGVGYRLRIGEFSLVTGVFPLGLQRGTEAEFRVQGFNLGGMSAFKVAAPAEAAPRSTLPVPIPREVVERHGPPLDSGRVSVGDAPELFEEEKPAEAANDTPQAAQRVPERFTANGTIGRGSDHAQGSDQDLYRFTARKGERLIVDIEAQRLGSSLDPSSEVLDAAGRPIERAVLRPVAKSFITLSDRDARSPGLRVESWADLRLNDHVMVGNEVLRVRALPDYADEDVIFFSRGGARLGHLDTTPGFRAVNDAVYKVEIHPPGTAFPPNGMPLFHLHFRNDDGGPGYGRDSRVHFEPPADGEYLVRVSDVLGAGGPRHSYRLSVREPRSDFNFSLDAFHLNIPAGGLAPLSARVERVDGFDGEVRVEVEGLPDGFRAHVAPILPGEESTSLCIEATAEARSTPPDFTFQVLGRAEVAGREVVKKARGGMLTVVPPSDIALSVEPARLEIAPGGKVKVTVRVERRNGFRARVPLDVVDLPHGVYVMDTGLNGIMITERETERTYVIYAEPWVKPFQRTFFTIGTVETRSPVGSRHAAPPQSLRLGPRKPAPAAF